jgi:XTP/dITP diphosphohydrolase
MKTIILATNNKHKKEKLAWIVGDFFDVVSDMPERVDVEENGETFEENAQIKASAISKKFNEYSIATDGGALIPSLGNSWNGLLTRRFLNKAEVTDWDRIEGLLGLLEGKTGDDRKVVWRESIAISDPEGNIIFSAEVEGDTGLIQTSYDKEQYREGIWLCTLTSYPQFDGKNFFELNEEETKEGEISWWKLKELAEDFFENKKAY